MCCFSSYTIRVWQSVWCLHISVCQRSVCEPGVEMWWHGRLWGLFWWSQLWWGNRCTADHYRSRQIQIKSNRPSQTSTYSNSQRSSSHSWGARLLQILPVWMRKWALHPYLVEMWWREWLWWLVRWGTMYRYNQLQKSVKLEYLWIFLCLFTDLLWFLTIRGRYSLCCHIWSRHMCAQPFSVWLRSLHHQHLGLRWLCRLSWWHWWAWMSHRLESSASVQDVF